MKIENIKELKPGLYEIRFEYRDLLTRKVRVCKRKIVGSLGEALVQCEKLKTLAAAGELDSLKAKKEEPLAFWIEDYLAYRENRQNVAFSTLDVERKRLRGCIKADVGEWYASGIKTRHLDELIEFWIEQPSRNGGTLSPVTVKNRFGVLRRFLKFVFKKLDLPFTPLTGVDMIRIGSKEVGRSLKPKEAHDFLEHLKIHYFHWYALFLALLLTGQRWGSVSALQWSDIDFIGDTITFNRSHYRGRVKEKNKSAKLVRMPLTSALREAFLEHLAFCQSENYNGWESTELVFYTRSVPGKTKCEGFLNSSDPIGTIQKVCEVVGIERFTPHDFRRSFNTWLVDASVPGPVVRSLTGHSKEALTDHYYRGDFEAKSKALEAASNLVWEERAKED